MTEAKVSVVVPVRDGALTLPALLAALERQTFPRKRFEVVVVDNGSSDGSGELAERSGARVVHEPEPSRARARNAGVAASDASLIAFTDADCRPDPGWLAALVDSLQSAVLAAGPIRAVAGDPPNLVERLELAWRFPQERNVREHGWSETANLGARREAFERTGGFDTAYRHVGEDVDFCLRARAAGFELAWCPDAVVEHDVERELRPVLRRAFLYGYASNQHHHRLPGVGHTGPEMRRRYLRHPLPLVRGDWVLERFGVEPATLQPAERRRMKRIARLEYAARVLGSAWAGLRRAR